MMAKCQRCKAEEEAGMACLTCPCSSSESTTGAEKESQPSSMKEVLNMEDLIELDITQLQNLCVNGNLEATGSRVTLIDRLLRRFNFDPKENCSFVLMNFLQLWFSM